MHTVLGQLLTKPAWRRWLKTYLYTSQLALFKHFRNGLIYFSVGGICIYLANSSMQASLQQELVTLFGLLLCGFGFLYAMLSYLRIVVSRMAIFFTKK